MINTHDKVCPNCGHCPTCGRSNARPWQWQPHVQPYIQPWQPYGGPYWGTITIKQDPNIRVTYASDTINSAAQGFKVTY